MCKTASCQADCLTKTLTALSQVFHPKKKHADLQLRTHRVQVFFSFFVLGGFVLSFCIWACRMVSISPQTENVVHAFHSTCCANDPPRRTCFVHCTFSVFQEHVVRTTQRSCNLRFHSTLGNIEEEKALCFLRCQNGQAHELAQLRQCFRMIRWCV